MYTLSSLLSFFGPSNIFSGLFLLHPLHPVHPLHPSDVMDVQDVQDALPLLIKNNLQMMLSDNDIFTALFLALVTGALAVRLAIALYV